MPVILTLFDAKIGPITYISFPKSIQKEILDKVLILMNQELKENEVIINDYKAFGMKCYTMHVTIPSEWARGNKDFLQISALTRIEDSPSRQIENALIEFKKTVLQVPTMYMGLYNNYIPVDPDLDPKPDKNEIRRNYDRLVDACKVLYDNVSAGIPPTHGCITAASNIVNGHFPVPGWLVQKIQSVKTPDVFIVFRKDSDGTFTVKIIPLHHDALKVKVKMKQLRADQIMQIGMAIQLKLLFSSGICRESTKDCFYEGYFEYENDFSLTSVKIRKSLGMLTFVENVEITRIERGS